MKKITALFLSLVILLGIICSSALTVSAASSNNGWEEILTYSELSENNQDVVRSIKIYKKDDYNFFTCKSSLKITTADRKNNRTIIKTYETPMYTSWYRFTGTPLTAKEICEKDKKLNQSQIFPIIECLTVYLEMANNPGNLIGAALEFKNDFNKGLITILEDTPDVQSIAFSRCKSLLGIETPLSDFIGDSKDLISDANAARSFAEMMKNNCMKYVNLMTIEIDPEHIQNLINNEVDLFFNKFNTFAK